MIQAAESDRSGDGEIWLLPVLSQLHDDVSSRGEDNEGHSQHGAANTQLFHFNTQRRTKTKTPKNINDS